jgi:hypothetical protein
VIRSFGGIVLEEGAAKVEGPSGSERVTSKAVCALLLFLDVIGVLFIIEVSLQVDFRKHHEETRCVYLDTSYFCSFVRISDRL